MYASQGRYGGNSSYGSGSYGGSQGRWSTPQSQPVPTGHSGFRSALSTYKGGGASSAAGGLGGFSHPSSSAPARTGFKHPIPSSMRNRTTSLGAAAVRPSLAATAGIPLAPIPTSRPVVDGPPGIVETRGSLINDAVLLNPKLSAPGPSKSNDLLASFQKGAENDLDIFKKLAAEKPAATDPATTAAPDLAPPAPSNGSGPPMSPKAKGTKRRAPTATVPTRPPSTRKKAKK